MNINELSKFLENELQECLPGKTNPDDAMYRVGYRDAIKRVLDKVQQSDTVEVPHSNITIVRDGYLGKVE